MQRVQKSFKKIKKFAVFPILIATFSVFLYYFYTHPQLINNLTRIPFSTLLLLVLLYLVFAMTLVFILDYSLLLCNKQLETKELTILTAYSSIINFFGPLQSGPGFRTVYLKAKHNVSIKDYVIATLIYYLFFAVISGLFLISGILKPWEMGTLIILTIATFVVSVPIFRKNKIFNRLQLSYSILIRLAVATFAQIAIVLLIYYIELLTIDNSITFLQALRYTGAANFAMFVALTPGSIGIRESFLLFSTNIHHISSNTIIAASVIDRTMYVIFLGVLFLLTLVLHAKDKLILPKTSPTSAEEF